MAEDVTTEDLTETGAETHGHPAAPDGSAIDEIPVQVSVVLGETRMQVADVRELSRGHVVGLNRKAGEAVDIYANDRLVARGELTVLDDDQHLGVKLTEIVRGSR